MSRASQHLHISQQALSRHVSKLEEELNTQLFVRAHPLALTAAGQAFYKTAKEILRLRNQYELEFKNNTFRSSTIRVGIGNTVGRAILPYVLPGYFAAHPHAHLKFIEDAPENLKKTINYDGLDIVIGSISDLPKSYKMIHLCKKEQLLIVPKQIMDQTFPNCADEMRQRFSVAYADLKAFQNAPFIQMDQSYAAGRIQNEYYRYFRIEPEHCIELINSDVAFHLACTGIGILIYSKLFFDSFDEAHRALYRKQVDVFPLPPLNGLDTVCAYYPRDRYLSPVAKEFLRACQEFFATYNENNMLEY